MRAVISPVVAISLSHISDRCSHCDGQLSVSARRDIRHSVNMAQLRFLGYLKSKQAFFIVRIYLSVTLTITTTEILWREKLRPRYTLYLYSLFSPLPLPRKTPSFTSQWVGRSQHCVMTRKAAVLGLAWAEVPRQGKRRKRLASGCLGRGMPLPYQQFPRFCRSHLTLTVQCNIQSSVYSKEELKQLL